MPDAWDFGVAAGVAGWLMDSQTDRIVSELRAQQSARQSGEVPAHPVSRLHGWPIDWAASSLHLGELLERSRLAVTIGERLSTGGGLSLEARPKYREANSYAGMNGLDPTQLTVTVLVTDLDPDTPVWIAFAVSPDGFSASRLLPVFDGTGPPGHAYCKVTGPEDAANVVEWGLEQFQLTLRDLFWFRGR